MPFKAVVTDINTVDEAHRDFYVEKDGKFILDVTPTDGFELDNVGGLKTALGAERNIKKGLEDKLKVYEGIDPVLARQSIENLSAFGDITPDKAREAIETAERLAAFDPQKEADKIAEQKLATHAEQLKAQAKLKETELSSANEALQNTIGGLTQQLQTLMKDNQIKGELAKLNPLDDARDAIELLAGNSVKSSVKDGQVIVEVLDENGHPRIKDSQGTPFTVSDLLAEIKEKRPGLFKAEDKSGVGLRPNAGSPGQSTGPNPYAKDTWNLTQQWQLEKTKPDVAKQLKAQAGA